MPLSVPLPLQGSSMAKQISAPYIECSAQQSENSVRDIFHVATLACINKSGKGVKRGKTSRGAKRISHMPGRPDLAAVASDLRKDKAKSCSVMWLVMQWWTKLRLRTGTARAGSQPITHPEGGRHRPNLRSMSVIPEYPAQYPEYPKLCSIPDPSQQRPTRKLSVSEEEASRFLLDVANRLTGKPGGGCDVMRGWLLMEGRKEYLGTCWTRAKGSNFVGRSVWELSVNKDRGAPGVWIKDFSFVLTLVLFWRGS